MTHAQLHGRHRKIARYGSVRRPHPWLSRAHSQGESIEELTANLKEDVEMLLEDGEPALEGEFVGTAMVKVGACGPWDRELRTNEDA